MNLYFPTNYSMACLVVQPFSLCDISIMTTPLRERNFYFTAVSSLENVCCSDYRSVTTLSASLAVKHLPSFRKHIEVAYRNYYDKSHDQRFKTSFIV